MLNILNKINEPEDLKKLSEESLNKLAGEVREVLLQKLSIHGGHFGPNFGIVEATIALHYVFNSPIDKIIYDVSHQSYTHKILTGRKDAFIYEEKYDDVTGYSDPDESKHDFFKIGHTSTSISLASGIAKARDLKGENYNVIAVIGDGALSGGEALEGLDFVGEQKTNFIIVVNDNDMSIAENHGGLYKNLKQLRETNGTCECNLFKAMGLDYMYVNEGNNIGELIKAFKKVKDINHPIVVHINTKKGKGYKIAEENKENWHWCMPFDTETGKSKFTFDGEDYGTLTADYLLEKIKKDEKIVVMAAGVPTNIGFTKEKRDIAGKQFVDVGIAEEHGIAMASGIAENGGKPIFATHSSFMQRTYDQLSQDLCINNNSATILINTASVYGMNDVTHLGIYDIALISNIPNMIYLAPTSKEEYFAMLDWSIEQNEYPVAIRIPCNGVISDERKIETDYSKINKYKVEKKGKEIAVLALGDFYQLGEEVQEEIHKKLNIQATLINPRDITGLDKELLERLKLDHDIVITLEDGMLEGGFGEKIARFYGDSSVKVKNYGIAKSFYDRYDVNELLKENGITKEQIIKDIENLLPKCHGKCGNKHSC